MYYKERKQVLLKLKEMKFGYFIIFFPLNNIELSCLEQNWHGFDKRLTYSYNN